MNQEEMAFLKKYLSDEKQFIYDGYYRLREINDEIYEFAFLDSDACGATSVHPQITIEWNGQKWQPTKLLDFVTTPVKNISYSDETSKYLSAALKDLYNKCYFSINKNNY